MYLKDPETGNGIRKKEFVKETVNRLKRNRGSNRGRNLRKTLGTSLWKKL